MSISLHATPQKPHHEDTKVTKETIQAPRCSAGGKLTARVSTRILTDAWHVGQLLMISWEVL
jgi:hypothetical protein